MSKIDTLSISSVIDIVVCACYFIEISNERIIKFIYPRGEDKIYSSFLYDSVYSRALKEGILPTEEVDKLVLDRGIITEADKKKLEDIEKKIVGQKTLYSKMKFALKKKEQVKRNIERLEEEAYSLRRELDRFYSVTAESVATEAKVNYLVWASAYNKDSNERLWNTYDDFELEKDMSFRSSVANLCMNLLIGFSETTLRKVARNSEWRVRYVSSMKTSMSLFSRSADDYTRDQLGLVYWSNYYQSVYEMLSDDRPPDDIIENDMSLDSYMAEYYKNLDQEHKVAQAKKSVKGSNAFDREEVIVTRFSDMYEDLEYDTPRESAKAKDDVTELKVKKRHRKG